MLTRRVILATATATVDRGRLMPSKGSGYACRWAALTWTLLLLMLATSR
jgi:hypothetical protein